jgi:hypothetical protein
MNRDIYIGRFLNRDMGFEYRVGRSNDINLTLPNKLHNKYWTYAQQVIVYGESKPFFLAQEAMEYALNMYAKLSHLENPVDTVFYNSEFPKWTMEEAREITCRPSSFFNILSTSNDNGVEYGRF